jgi:hypothetical protein
VFGQQAVDLGFKSVVALPGEGNPKVEHCQPCRLPEELQILIASSRRWRKNCGGRRRLGEWLPRVPGVIALADHLEDELCGP